MKRLLLTLSLAFSVLFSAAAQSVEANLVEAVQLYSDGRIKQANELLKTLSVAAPGNDAVWYYLALTETLSNNLDSAQVHVEKAVQLDSSNYWYRRMQARMYLMNKKADEGVALYEKLVKDFPDKTESVYELLDVYLNRKEFEKALSALDDIERQRGTSEELVRTRFEVLSAMGRQEEGAEVLEKFNGEFATPSILTVTGDYYLSEFKDSLARARYEEALSLDSGYIPALLGLSEVHRHQRHYDEYFRTLEPFIGSQDVPAASKSMYIGNLSRSIDPKILQIHRAGFDSLVNLAGATHPGDSTVLSAVGSYYYSSGRTEEAGKWFKASADAFPESIGQTATYIQYLSLQKKWEEMQQRSLDAFHHFKELAFLDYANMANYELKDYDAIIGNCMFLLKTFPKEKEICLGAWAQMGDAMHSKGDSKGAFKAYEKALKINPNYAPVLNNYAYYLSIEGKKLKKAYNMSRKTVEAEPDNATYLDTFAWILHLMGKDVEAKPFFKHAMLYGGKDSAVVLEHYAIVLEALGEKDTAQIYRNMAKRIAQ